MQQVSAIIAGFESDVEELRPQFEHCPAAIQWQGINPQDHSGNGYQVPLPTADVVLYVLSPDCLDSCKLKAHLAHVEIKCQAEQSYVMPIRGANANRERHYFEFLHDLPVVSLRKAIKMLGGKPRRGSWLPVWGRAL